VANCQTDYGKNALVKLVGMHCVVNVTSGTAGLDGLTLTLGCSDIHALLVYFCGLWLFEFC